MLKTETPRSVDISGECCALLECLMLAQAQEMFFELLCVKKAESTAIKWATLASAAWSVSELYAAAAEAYMKPQLVKHITREWGECNKVKALMYQAEAHFMQVRQLISHTTQVCVISYDRCIMCHWVVETSGLRMLPGSIATALVCAPQMVSSSNCL